MEHDEDLYRYVADRIKAGQRFMSKFARFDATASRMFRDASGQMSEYFDIPDADMTLASSRDDDWLEGGDMPDAVTVTGASDLGAAILTKAAGLAIKTPEWRVKAADEQASRIVAEWLSALWSSTSWRRVIMKALIKRCISGLGVIAYRWSDDYGPRIEHVQPWDLALDMFHNEFDQLSWGARRIRLPMGEIAEKYDVPDLIVGDPLAPARMWLFWDKQLEVHVVNERVLYAGPNLYNRVPLLFLLGDIDPNDTVFPLGDTQLAAGILEELSELRARLSATAKHGGTINILNKAVINNTVEEALTELGERGWLGVEDMPQNAVMRLPGEQVTNAMLEALNQARVGLDSLTGVNDYMRGVIQQSVQFATEAHMISSLAGARPLQNRLDFEAFVNAIATVCIWMQTEFGGPNAQTVITTEQQLLWEACSAVHDVRVIEASTTYRDPMADLQASLQVLTAGIQLTQIMAGMGFTVVPNLQEMLNDVLRSSGKPEVERYWIAMQPQLPAQPQQEETNE